MLESIIGINKSDKVWSGKKLLKVIGEISPAALNYVKDGQEFKEDDVAFAICEPWEPDAYVSYEDWLKSGFHKEIHIKGPCGHFH
jgi:hypothetical protein